MQRAQSVRLQTNTTPKDQKSAFAGDQTLNNKARMK